MKKSRVNPIHWYFIQQSKVLIESFKSSNVMSAHVVGSERELLLKNFLEAHLPDSVKIGNRGQITDSSGLVSNETDLIIYSPLGFVFGVLNFFLSENVMTIMNVKSTLDDKKLESALKNIDKVKKLSRFYSAGSMASGGLSEKIPCGIFAFSSDLKVRNIVELVDKHYLPKTDDSLKVNWICILNSFFIVNNYKGNWKKIDAKTKADKPIKKGYVTVARKHRSLFPMLSEATREATRVISATPDIRRYIIESTGKN